MVSSKSAPKMDIPLSGVVIGCVIGGSMTMLAAVDWSIGTHALADSAAMPLNSAAQRAFVAGYYAWRPHPPVLCYFLYLLMFVSLPLCLVTLFGEGVLQPLQGRTASGRRHLLDLCHFLTFVGMLAYIATVLGVAEDDVRAAVTDASVTDLTPSLMTAQRAHAVMFLFNAALLFFPMCKMQQTGDGEKKQKSKKQ